MGGEADEHATCDATVTLAFSVLGKRWNGMIISALGTDSATFGGLRRAVPGISDAVLSDRLAELAATKLLSREVLPGPPVAVTYRLTESGVALLPILIELGEWAANNLFEDAPTPSSS